MEDPRPNPGTTLTENGVSRRTVVLGVSAVGAAGLLTACGGSSGGGSTAASTDSSSSAPSESASASAGGGSGKAGLAKTADVPVGGGTINTAQKVVVTQPTKGTFKGFSAICTHMGCTVASVQNGTITCPCHGSQYSATDGSVQGGPSTTPLPPVAVTVQGDEVVKA